MREKRPDYVFAIMLAVLLFLGLVMVTSASGPVAYQKFGDTYWYLKHQLLYGLLPGAVLFMITSRVDYRRWRALAAPLLVASVILLVLVFVPGIGADWGTSRSWINIGGFSLQPAEIVKLTFLFYLAAWLEARGEEGVRDVSSGLLPFLGVLGLLGVLIVLQPDLGSLLVLVAMALVVYFLAGAPWPHLFGIVVGGFGVLAILIKSAPYRAARFMTFLHPELDPTGIGYHINQAFLAIGSGGLFGVGLGHSRQKYLYLPEVVGDSIFAVMAEELGYVVMVMVLALLLVFIMRGLQIARNAPDMFGKFIVAGVMGWIFFQTLFNVGSMLGLLPITGLPMPLVSYGGTALMVVMAAMGVIFNISRHTGEAKTVRRR